MGMQIGSSEGDEDLNSTINTTPLVDVMLVLLIIFLITIPVVTTSVKVILPLEKNALRETKPENIILSVGIDGRLFYYDSLIKDSEDLKTRLRRARDDAKKPTSHRLKSTFAVMPTPPTNRSAAPFCPFSRSA